MDNPEQEPLEQLMPQIGDVTPESAVLASVQRPIANGATPPPRRDGFPPWSVWDVLAVVGFTVAAILLFSLLALGIGHLVTSKHHVSINDLATNPIVVIGS